jgi:hypothetical protein
VTKFSIQEVSLLQTVYKENSDFEHSKEPPTPQVLSVTAHKLTNLCSRDVCEVQWCDMQIQKAPISYVMSILSSQSVYQSDQFCPNLVW